MSWLPMAGVLLSLAPVGQTEETRDLEEDLFGETVTEESHEQSTEAERGAGETRDEGLDIESRLRSGLEEREDPLDLGGQLFLRLEYSHVAGVPAAEQRVSSPNLLDLYADLRPSDRIRAYARGRVRHDFTRSNDMETVGALGRTTGTGTLDTSGGQTSVLLDQMWLNFDLSRRVFLTVGRQRIRWGTGRFWNPTDFLNRQFRDPLAIFDERLGVGLVKVHVPIESLGWNLYAIGNFEEAQTVEDIGGALRAEMLFASTEVSVTAAGRSGTPFQLGADVSSALGLFDVHAEAALLYDSPGPFFRAAADDEVSPIDEVAAPVVALLGVEVPDEFRAIPVDRSDEWIVQASAGAEIQLAYSPQDSVFVGAEYFFFNVGQRDASIYPTLLSAGAFVPLYTGQHYGALYAALPNPGDWNRSTFSVSTLGNLSDRSFISRVDFSTDLLTFGTFNAYASANWGRNGEFRYRYALDPVVDGTDALPQLPDEQQALVDLFTNGIRIDPPRFNVGFALRIAL